MQRFPHISLIASLSLALLLVSLFNFTIAFAQDIPSPDKHIIVDDFEDGQLNENAIGGIAGCYANNVNNHLCQVVFEGNHGVLEMQYDVPNLADSFAIYSSELLSLSVSSFDAVWISIRGSQGNEPIALEIKDCGPPESSHYAKVPLNDFLSTGILSDTWRAVVVPLSAFSEITDWSCIERLNVLASGQLFSGAGTIYIDDLRILTDHLLLDSFTDKAWDNELDAESGFWSAPGTQNITFTYTYPDENLVLNWDTRIISDAVEQATYWTSLRGSAALSGKDVLQFTIRGATGGEQIAVQLQDCGLDGNPKFPKVLIGDYLIDGITQQEQTVQIPISAFADGIDVNCIEHISFYVSGDPTLNSQSGQVTIDNLGTTQTYYPTPLILDRFDDCNNWSSMFAPWTTGTDGTATVTTRIISDTNGCAQSIAYDVDGFASSWAGIDLQGLDVTRYSNLTFDMRGLRGNEEPRIYLRDKNGVEQSYDTGINVTTAWRRFSIPLSAFPGLDLAQLAELRIALEWKPMQGEILVDNIRFDVNQAYLPIVSRPNPPDASPVTACPSPPLPPIDPRFLNFEPNDQRCSATTQLLFDQPLESYIFGPTDTSDYYILDIESLDRIHLDLDTRSRKVDYDLYIYDGLTGGILASSKKSKSSDESIEYRPTRTGRHYVRVYPFRGSTYTPYVLELTKD